MKKEQIPIIFDTPMPDTTDIERMVLADAICAPDTFGETSQFITADFFTSQSRRRVWDTLTQRYNAGLEISNTAMATASGKDYIEEVMPKAAEAGMRAVIPEHAIALRDGAAKRRAYAAAASFLAQAVAPQSSEQDILAYCEQFKQAVEGPSPICAELTLAEVLKDVRDEAKRVQQAAMTGKTIRVTTGFKYMDAALNGGFKAGQLVILAARPSVGKTALMLQLARAAARGGNAAQIFSIEMPAEELGERMLFSTGEVRPYAYHHGEVEWRAYDRGEQTLLPLEIYINDFTNSLDGIVARMTQAVKKGRCKIVFIDYLGLMADALNFGNAKLYQVIGRITGTLKAVSKRLQVPIILLCQLNRDQAREGRAPELYDLRDSGSIEQDADVVLMLENDIEHGRLKAHLRKNRSGKKEITFVMIPNDTFSAFTEDNPIGPDGAVMQNDYSNDLQL